MASNNCCILCEYPCETCSSPNTCATCASAYASIPSSNNLCLICSVPFCESCSTQTSCTLCKTGYTLKVKNGMDYCAPECSNSSNCRTCPSSPNICTDCLPGFVLQNSTCIACQNFPQCQVCDPTNTNSCQVCSPGYYLNQ